MQVRRIGFVGTRAADVPATEAFFRDVLGLETIRRDADWSILKLPTGGFDFFEVYGTAFADVQAAGFEPGEIVWAEQAFEEPAYAGYGWFFVHAPDGNVYCIQQTSD